MLLSSSPFSIHSVAKRTGVWKWPRRKTRLFSQGGKNHPERVMPEEGENALPNMLPGTHPPESTSSSQESECHSSSSPYQPYWHVRHTVHQDESVGDEERYLMLATRP